MEAIPTAAMAIVLLASLQAGAFAGMAPGTGVQGSVHDMTLYNSPVSTTDPEATQGRVCAYCHTPHHAAPTGNDYLPLWARKASTTTFTPYASSTINSKIEQATFIEGPTRLCMSCHDGSIAVDTHYAFTGTKMLAQDDTFFSTPAVGQNGQLANDHPLGFVYDGALYTEGVATGPAIGDTAVSAHVQGKNEWIRVSDATYIGSTLRISERLYPSPTYGNKGIMTCSTCHDVHNRKNRGDAGSTNYLLLAPNSKSQLCLSCHIK